MDNVVVKVLKKPKLKNPILVEGLPGIGLVGKLAGDHLTDELKAEKFVEIYSPFFPPQVNIQRDGTVKLVNNELHYWIGKKNDLILLTGDFQGITPDSQYHLAETMAGIATEYGVKRMFTLGGLGTGNITQTPKVYGAATSRKLVEELKGYGVIFQGSGAIFGASGLLLGLGIQKGIEAACLMGETHGQIIDAKSAEAVLRVLTKILGVEIDMTKLDKKAKETEKQIGEITKMVSAQQKMLEREQEFMNEPPSYIR